jgi:hypothetical protein
MLHVDGGLRERGENARRTPGKSTGSVTFIVLKIGSKAPQCGLSFLGTSGSRCRTAGDHQPDELMLYRRSCTSSSPPRSSRRPPGPSIGALDRSSREPPALEERQATQTCSNGDTASVVLDCDPSVVVERDRDFSARAGQVLIDGAGHDLPEQVK